MSNSAHSKSTYRLKSLPKCTKCNREMVLVMVSYEGKRGNFWEWECFKCNKSYSRNTMREEKDKEENIFLNNWCINEKKRRTRERSLKKVMSNDFPKQTDS